MRMADEADVNMRGHEWMSEGTAGALTAARFLRTYWQKKALFARSALTEVAQRFEPAMLIELASRDDVESRLVRREGKRWSVEHGPFPRRRLERLPARGWSLLVQGADLHLPAARALMDRFDFIPYARHDDVMLSLSPPGGGVGAHFDSYDVFLVQALGCRRWRIGRQRDLALQPDAPLRILKSFRPEREYAVEPGDVLYLPPRYAHEGVATTQCITCSVGFRAPSRQEIATSFLQWLPDRLTLTGRYRDRETTLPKHPAQIGTSMVREIEAMLAAVRWSRATVEQFAGEQLTEPKAQVWFRAPERIVPFARFLAHARAHGVRLAASTRMLFRGDRLFVNGECVRMPPSARAALIALADERAALPWRSRSLQAARQMHEWYRAGYVELA
ncbi:MAG: cupin domain-containing protein [Betaproteobacteria bacterium]|nr:cupin domain-containing protein [Betaproteobacteria bacterium]